MKFNILTAILLALPCFLKAADKDAFTLFNPTPRDQMREMSTDRPDITESAYSVDAGHVQVEATLFGFAKDGDVESYLIGGINFKLGLTNSTDLQFVAPLYEHQRGGEDDDSGIGDLIVRYKWNLWGNDGGDSAFALMPYVKAPTSSHDLGNDKVEGGLIIPLAVKIGERIGLGFMAQFDIAYDDITGDYGMDFVNSVTCGLDLTERLGGYVEFVSISSTREDEGWQGYVSTGVTYAVTDDFVLDAGLLVGVSDDAQDIAPFAGLSFRF